MKIKGIIDTEEFKDEYNSYKKKNEKEINSLISFLDNIETNKKYYRMNINKNRRYKKENTEDTLSIKKINSDINKLSEMNYSTLKPLIIQQINKEYMIPYLIENIMEKSILHTKYIPLYVGVLNDIPFDNKYSLILKICNKYYEKFFDFKIQNNNETTYLKLCAKNKNTDNIIGYSLLITHLEKENIISGYIDKVLEPFMVTISNNEDDNEVFNMLTSFYNISELYYKDGIPQNYVRVLNDLKQKTSLSKIKFKIMDILGD